MSRFTVKRSYKQLIAERNAMRLAIKDNVERIERGEKMARYEREFHQLKITKERLESDKALLAEIERDIEIAKEKMGK